VLTERDCLPVEAVVSHWRCQAQGYNECLILVFLAVQSGDIAAACATHLFESRRCAMAYRAFLSPVTALIASLAVTAGAHAAVNGKYVEVRSCDVYTGPCFANAEMGLEGREAILTWSIQEGEFDGVKLDGLNVIAVVRSKDTMGDVARFATPARSVVIVDKTATAAQREALLRFVTEKAGNVHGKTVKVEAAPISVDMCVAGCAKEGCATVRAGNLVEVETRCLGGKDHVCGNEELYYPPLTEVAGARAAFTVAGAFHGDGLDTKFNEANRRSAYLASFSD
jgi:hypothetical protein